MRFGTELDENPAGPSASHSGQRRPNAAPHSRAPSAVSPTGRERAAVVSTAPRATTEPSVIQMSDGRGPRGLHPDESFLDLRRVVTDL